MDNKKYCSHGIRIVSKGSVNRDCPKCSANQKARRTLNKRTENEWITELKKIQDPKIRSRLAKLVAWDYEMLLSSQIVRALWNDFGCDLDVPEKVVERVLYKLGYSKLQAKRRATKPKEAKRNTTDYRRINRRKCNNEV